MNVYYMFIFAHLFIIKKNKIRRISVINLILCWTKSTLFRTFSAQ